MKRPMEHPWPTKDCFMCGPDSECGVHIAFDYDDETHAVSTEYIPERRFVGQGDILHGAIQFGLLDEAMGWMIHADTGLSAVTTNMNVDFLRPAYVKGTPLLITCRINERHGSKIWLEARLADSEGELCTRATGSFHIVKDEKYESLVRAR